MSEYQRANSFGTGWLEMKDVYIVKFENKTKKRFFEVAGDSKALEAFNKLPDKPISYKWDKEKGMVDATNGKDYFLVEVKDPDGIRMLKTCSHEDYLKLCKKYGIVSEGRWKEWGKGKQGQPIQVPVQE